MKRNEYLFNKLQLLADYGVKIFINGDPATPAEVVDTVDRDEKYRPGFAYTAAGDLSELNYVRIA